MSGSSSREIFRDSSGGIFLSYRHEDAGAYARLLKSEFSKRLPRTRIFMDLDSIEAGEDFVSVIQEAIDSCAVMVALIGRQWAALTSKKAHQRLDNPTDYVSFEIQTAFECGVRVIPVLVDGAEPLRQQQLPSELQQLARLNAHKLSYDRYQDDADRLLEILQRALMSDLPVAYSPHGPDIEAGRQPEDLRQHPLWSANLAKKTRKMRSLNVRLTNETHYVEFIDRFWDKAVFVDGQKKTSKPANIDGNPTYSFTLSDGTEERYATITVINYGYPMVYTDIAAQVVSLGAYRNFGPFTLTVDGEILYQANAHPT